MPLTEEFSRGLDVGDQGDARVHRPTGLGVLV
jgi:hypothetical protein